MLSASSRLKGAGVSRPPEIRLLWPDAGVWLLPVAILVGGQWGTAQRGVRLALGGGSPSSQVQ